MTFKLMTLEYADKTLRVRSSIAGFCSLPIVLLQYPWFIIVVMVSWSDRSVPSSAGEVAFWFVALLPTIVCVTLAGYSLWKSGIGRRNICGPISLVIVALEAAFVTLRLLTK